MQFPGKLCNFRGSVATSTLGALSDVCSFFLQRPSESCKSITSGSTQGSLAPSPVGDEDDNFTGNEDDKSDEICLAKKQRFIEEHEVPEMPFFPPSIDQAPPHPLQPHQYPFVSLGVDPTMWYQWAASAAR